MDQHPKGVVYGEGSFTVPRWCGPSRSCPSSCWTGNALDKASYQCNTKCAHCDDDAIIGHGGANVWVHVTTPSGGGSGHRRLEDDTLTTPEPLKVTAVANNVTTATHRRQAQSGGGGFGNLGGFQLPKAPACPLSSLHTRLGAVNKNCCTKASPCIGGMPNKCDIHCALEFSDFWVDCGHVLKESFKAQSKVFSIFHRKCGQAFDLKSLIETASSTVCDAVPKYGGVAWQQINEKMTSWSSAVAHCKSQQKDLCQYERVCPQGAGHPPTGGLRSGDQWVPVAGSPNSWVQAGTWGGSQANSCVRHEQIAAGKYGKPAWGLTASHASYEGWVMCC